MDWIEVILEKLRNKLTKLSIRKTLMIYITISIVAVLISFVTTISICERWKRLVLQGQYKNEEYIKNHISNSLNDEYCILSKGENKTLAIIEFLRTWSVFFYSIVAVIITSKIFYRNKLKEPLNILMEEAKHISRNELDVECKYKINDEMGELCNTVDMMRIELIDNNKKMWNSMEEQRRLNAAFAHDLRTPLTVLNGYTEILTKYYPEGKISDEKLIDTLTLMDRQIKRLEKFANTMTNINRLEEISVNKKLTCFGELKKHIEENLSIISETKKIHITVESNVDENKEIFIDEGVVIEVIENLIGNASRYAKNRIEIILTKEEEQLMVYVRDDGRGFSKEEFKMATRPYYSDKHNNPSEHLGIGLTICNILCQKHGGSLGIANSMDGGAIVTAIFYVL